MIRKLSHRQVQCKKERKRVHWPGIEPGPLAWQARILPCTEPPVLRIHVAFFKRLLGLVA